MLVGFGILASLLAPWFARKLVDARRTQLCVRVTHNEWHLRTVFVLVSVRLGFYLSCWVSVCFESLSPLIGRIITSVRVKTCKLVRN